MRLPEVCFEKVHSIYGNNMHFEMSLNNNETRLLTVLTGDSNVPDGILVDKIDPKLVSNETICLYNYGTKLAYRNREYELPIGEDKNMPLMNLINYKDIFIRLYQSHAFFSTNGMEKLPTQIQKKSQYALRFVCKNFYIEKTTRFQQSIDYLIGLGPGLTPSGDDWLLGVMFVHSKPLIIPYEALKKTTSVSRKYLQCAMEGDFPEVVQQIVPPTLGSMCTLAKVGSHSGKDILFGMFNALLVS